MKNTTTHNIHVGQTIQVKGATVRVTGAGDHAGTWRGRRLDDQGEPVGDPVDFRDTDVQPTQEHASGGGGGCAASQELLEAPFLRGRSRDRDTPFGDRFKRSISQAWSRLRGERPMTVNQARDKRLFDQEREHGVLSGTKQAPDARDRVKQQARRDEWEHFDKRFPATNKKPGWTLPDLKDKYVDPVTEPVSRFNSRVKQLSKRLSGRSRGQVR